MAEVDIEVGGRHYTLSCRAGEEDQLRALGAIVHAKTIDAAKQVGGLGELRQLLFAALLLADELNDLRAAATAKSPRILPPQAEESDPALATALERLAERMEALANRVESGRPNA